MVTIKDIAKLAGVAQGTVSNVLNGKGNVSSEKIRRVMDAAHQLGYVPNERAALLRKGLNDSLAVIMPSPRARQYTEFYSGFKHYAQSHGFLVTQHLINENTPSSEEEAFMDIKPLQVKGIACISTAAGTLVVAGENLHIGKLSLDGGELHVDGQIDSLSYEDQGAGRGGLLGRLFG